MTITSNIPRTFTHLHTTVERRPLCAEPAMAGAGGDESPTVIRAGVLMAEWLRCEAVKLSESTTGAFEHEQWTVLVEEFSRRNAGRLTILELSDADGNLYSREQGYPLFGAIYRAASCELEIILGETNGRRRHITRIVPDADALTLYRDDSGSDRALRIGHQGGEMLLSFPPAAE